MPALGIPFNDYPNYPKPKRVYCDSNFAVKLLNCELFALKPHLLKPVDRACMSFHQQLEGDGVELVGSLFTYSEVLHVYCFNFPKGMYDASEKFLRAKGVTVPPTPQGRYKEVVGKYKSDADILWNAISYRVEATEELFAKYGIRLLAPLPSPGLTNITKNVADFASVVKHEFSAIEATDAVHVSLASYLAADAIVSLDQGMLDVDGITVYWTA